MNDLLENLQRFIDAGDEERYYQLNRDEVRLILSEFARLQGTQVKIMTFDDIRNEVRQKRRAEAIAKGIDAEIKLFQPKDAS